MLADKSHWSCATAGLVLALAMTFHTGQSQAAKPEVLDSVIVTFVDSATMTIESSEVVGTSPSFDAKRSAKRGQVQVEIVVRDMDLSVPVGFDLAGGDICFSVDGAGTVPDEAPAAGGLTLFDDGTASFDLYANFRTVDGDMQSYSFFLEGQHNVDLSGNPVVGTVAFYTMDINTEGRGKKPKSCRGVVNLTDTGLVIAE